jgi:hypothetical protein
MKGRSLHDNYKLVKETAKLLRSKRWSSLLLKLDITKPFDTVTWQFSPEILQTMGFSDRWRAWISMILASSSTSILLNGIPGPKIWHALGVRQTDALSVIPHAFLCNVST